jgi:hypothetical protein
VLVTTYRVILAISSRYVGQKQESSYQSRSYLDSIPPEVRQVSSAWLAAGHITLRWLHRQQVAEQATNP